MKKILFGTTLVFALVLSSCSTFKKVDIVKRHYKGGYHIAVRDQKTKTEPVAVVKDKQSPDAVATVTPANTVTATPEQPVVQPTAVQENTPVVTAQKTETTTGSKKADKSSSPAIASVKKEPAKTKHQLRMPTYKSKTWSASRSTSGGDVNLIILVILAVILPPLAVYLAEGLTGKFWLTLILCLVGGGLAIGIAGYLGLAWLIAIIIALLAVMK
jgi:uncharacterized membrane protein YqaE (UPF0057 family)